MDRKRRLLLVEDEHTLRGLIAQFLRASGYEVVEAADGPEGAAAFAASGPFDLALLDLQLPGYSGVEVCRRIREARPDQPVMICSAAVSPQAEAALLALGVDQILTKPYPPEVLLARVARLLRPGAPPSGLDDRAQAAGPAA